MRRDDRVVFSWRRPAAPINARTTRASASTTSTAPWTWRGGWGSHVGDRYSNMDFDDVRVAIEDVASFLLDKVDVAERRQREAV